MKYKYNLILLSLLVGLNMFAQSSVISRDINYLINGNIGDITNNKLYLSSIDNVSVRDTADVQNGKFIFNGGIENIVKCALYTADFSLYKELWVDSTPITIIGNSSDLQISGSKTQKEAEVIDRLYATFQDQFTPLDRSFKQAVKEKDSVKIEKITLDWLSLKQKEIKAILQFIQDNPNSYVSLNKLYEISLQKGGSYEELKTSFKNLNKELQGSETGLKIIIQLDKIHKVGDGILAKDFSLPDENGNMIKLSDYQGKYILLDFWASWCGPCRAENPNLLKAYEEYHPKGLEVLAVSMDTEKDLWLKAVKADDLPWKQVMEQNGWKNSVASTLYQVTAIPANFLISPEGEIIADHLRGDNLRVVLDKIFK